MKPVYSYKKVTENGGLVYEIVGNYRDKDYEYRLTDKNGEKSGKIKLSGTYFDNEMIFALVRACPLDDRGTNLNFSFNVPSVLDDGAGLTAMKVVNAAGNAVAYQKKSAKDGELSESDYIFAENALHFSYTSAIGKGGGLEMYYLKTDDFKFAGQPTHIPVKIKQNGLEYIFVVNP
jgi:hypothetical protein